MIKIPKLKSRYIPVHSSGSIGEIHWWKNSSPFIYPNLLLNLMSTSKEDIKLLKEDNVEDVFLLTDSGGFQVVSGTCDLNWETSLLKQIELGASKIFSFDRPPTESKKSGSLSQFNFMTEEKAFPILEDNLKVALEQSKYLKEKYPNEFKKFCFIMQAKSIDQINHNFELFKKYLGSIENFSNYFPGGIVYGLRQNDYLFITIAARHAYENFIKKGIYVHFLGMGSFYKMLILIRNEITTFDSSTVLQGVRVNGFINPLSATNLSAMTQILSDNFMFTKEFCICPVCRNIDYQKLINENKQSMIGKYFIAHNLWHFMVVNVYLDSIDKKCYTQTVFDNFKINDEIKKCLEFCDECDKNGFEVTYEKYKHYLKKDETKQNTLF